MKTSDIKGIIPPVITPMNDDAEQTVNHEELRKQVERLLAGGVHGIFPLGTNGEAYALSAREKEEILATVIDQVKGRVPVYAGTGCITTAETIRMSKRAEELGADALSIITPSFAVASQKELYDHYVAVAKHVNIPIILYNIPPRTGNKLLPETVQALCRDVDVIVGAKDSSGDIENLKAYIRLTKELDKDVAILAGNDGAILTCLKEGGAGGIAGRANYHKALRAYFAAYEDDLCDTCKSRLEKNPMRILDCKSPICSKIAADAPIILDYLCDECSEHFQTLQSHLKALQIDFTINPKIVRGLDYYTKTVFEFVTTEIGAQGTVCGGGRYDGLIGQLGGADTPALGFAMGLERLLLTMQQQGCNFLETPPCDLYIAPMDAEALPKAMQLAQAVRESGYQAEYDLMHRGLKAQMKYANKIHATYVLVLGGNELEQQSAKLKQMETGEQIAIPLDDRFAEAFDNIAISHMFQNTLQEEA